MYEFQAIITY
uniref:Uncharacterized protein n=1 Tax=Moniliophthora roreri TaxID=221103 RepID=A0A0W0G2Q8_MONRR